MSKWASKQADVCEWDQKFKFCDTQQKSNLYLQWIRNMSLSRSSRSNRSMICVNQWHNQQEMRDTGISTVAWVWATVKVQWIWLGLADFAEVFGWSSAQPDLQVQHIHVWKKDVFHYFDVSRRTGFCWLAENESQRLHNHSDSGPDFHDWKRKLTHDELWKMKDILMSEFQYRILNWQQLATMTEISEVCDCTICDHM